MDTRLSHLIDTDFPAFKVLAHLIAHPEMRTAARARYFGVSRQEIYRTFYRLARAGLRRANGSPVT